MGDLRLNRTFPDIEYRTTVGGLGNPGDDGAHLLAKIFEGFTEGVNLVPMNSNLNRGAYAQFEAGLATALETPGTMISLQIEVIYEVGNNSVRPDRFLITGTITEASGIATAIRQPFTNS